MTKQQKDDALMVLGKGCQIQNKYVNDCGKTCAIGALAKASSIDRGVLEEMEADFIFQHVDVANQIQIKFGLSLENQRQIQAINDDNESESTRTKKVLAYVGSLEVTDE